MIFDIEANLKKLPDSPGVYLHKDRLGQIIYVGKAISLRNRVRQYFRTPKTADNKIKSLISHIAEFEYITCGTEMEALILECTLIKKHMPKYNVLLRDDKSYPFIKLTTNEDYPRVIKTRRVAKDGAKYFGPYTDVSAVNSIIPLINEIFMLKECATLKFPKNPKPCLNYHISKCRGICVGGISAEDYKSDIEQVTELLNGRTKSVTEFLKAKMLKASEEMDFEMAARFRDQIEAVKALGEKQRVALVGIKDIDIILTLRSENSYHVVLFFVRDGKLSGREFYPLDVELDENVRDLTSAFIKQYYTDSAIIPKEIVVTEEMAENELLEEYLSELADRSVKITTPKRGDKKALLELAKKDVDEMAKSIEDKAKLQKQRKHELGLEIYKVLNPGNDSETGYDGHEYRIESYDISNTNGVDTVGGMVVFEGTTPKRKDYRRFKVRTASASDDYGSLQEVIYRRFKRAQEDDIGFVRLPDLIFVDGGKAQISVVEKVLKAMKIDIPVLGMVKDDRHRSRGLIYKGEEVELKKIPVLYKYVGTVQEETHRFAVEYHRGLRDKKMRASALDNIEGVGEKRRNALLAHFGSVDKIKSASIDELCNAPGITKKVATMINEYFSKKD